MQRIIDPPSAAAIDEQIALLVKFMRDKHQAFLKYDNEFSFCQIYFTFMNTIKKLIVSLAVVYLYDYPEIVINIILGLAVLTLVLYAIVIPDPGFVMQYYNIIYHSIYLTTIMITRVCYMLYVELQELKTVSELDYEKHLQYQANAGYQCFVSIILLISFDLTKFIILSLITVIQKIQEFLNKRKESKLSLQLKNLLEREQQERDKLLKQNREISRQMPQQWSQAMNMRDGGVQQEENKDNYYVYRY